jgi:hypothetical protein
MLSSTTLALVCGCAYAPKARCLCLRDAKAFIKLPPKGKTTMNPFRKAVVAFGLVGTAIAGGVLGATVFAPGASVAQTSSTTPSSGSSSTATAPSGTFHSNEDPTHEAGESAAREAQEDAGQVPTVP